MKGKLSPVRRRAAQVMSKTPTGIAGFDAMTRNKGELAESRVVGALRGADKILSTHQFAMGVARTFKFRLYTAENTQNSALALTNLLKICKAHLGERYTIEVVDVIGQPERALSDGIRMTPTLIRLYPPPRQTIVGTLTQTERVMVALGISEAPA